jgi:hypothetical protein
MAHTDSMQACSSAAAVCPLIVICLYILSDRGCQRSGVEVERISTIARSFSLADPHN